MKIENDGQIGECLLAIGDYLDRMDRGEGEPIATLGRLLRDRLVEVFVLAREFSRQRAEEQSAGAQPLTAEGVEANVRKLMAEQQSQLAEMLEGVKGAMEKVGMPMPKPAKVRARPKLRKRKA